MPRSKIGSRIIGSEAAAKTVATVRFISPQISQGVSRWMLFTSCVTLLFAASISMAQSTTGSIYGQVTDSSKALVSGAKITALNQATGVSYPGTSDNQGNYAVFNLLPGIYNVTVEKSGFEAATIKDVRIVIDQKQLINFELKVGAVTDTMTITAAPTMLQTESAETGDVIQSHDIQDLPLLGRRFYDLTALTAGVSGGAGTMNSFNFSVNGQREYANSIQIDGVESTTNRTQDITATPSVDSIEEFKVSTSDYSAEFGKSAGGVVSIQTKGGTNQFHGTAYEFFRPNFTAAKSYGFTGAHIPPSELKQHNYGGTFGGPIFKNKTFFFASYEGTKQEQNLNSLYYTPPVNEITVNPDGSVDLSKLLDPLTGTPIPIYDPATTLTCQNIETCNPQQFSGNVIPANRVSKAGLNVLTDFFAKPNLPGNSFGWYQNFLANAPVTFDQRQADARLDHSFSNNDRLSAVFHYNWSKSLTENLYYGHTVVPGANDTDFANDQVSGAQEYSISELHSFSNRLFNEARVGYTRYYLDQYSLLSGHDWSTQYGVGNIAVQGFPATDGFPYIQAAYYFTGGSSYKPYYVRDNNYQFTDNVVLSSIGRHEFRFGADYRRLHSNPTFSLFPTGYQYYAGGYFGQSLTSDPFTPNPNYYAWFPYGGSEISDLLLGLPQTTSIGLQLTNPHTRSWEMDFYAQDTFKFSTRLTFNYGLRYEYQAPYTEQHNNMANYDPATDSMLLAGRGSNSAGLVQSRKTNFAPRLGVAYQINPKTVLRAGYGLFFTPENDGREDILTKNVPFAELNTYTNPIFPTCHAPTVCPGQVNYVLDTGVPRNTTIAIPSGASSIPTSTIPDGTSFTAYDINPHMRTGYSEMFNLSVQRELGSNFTLDAAFVGARSHELSYRVGNINTQDPVTGIPRITPYLNQVQFLSDQGWAEYNSLQLKLTKRVSRNLNFLASYTYGHNLDNGPAPFNLGQNNNYPQDPYNLNAEIASADNDIRHNFVFSGLYHLPVGRGQKFMGAASRATDLLVGGWQLNAIFGMHTGTPVNVVRGASLNTCPGVRPNLVGDPNGTPPPAPSGSTPTVRDRSYYAFNTAAFDSTPFVSGTPTACQPGSAGRNLITGPGYVNVDASMFKEFGITETAKIQTRFEFFNALNTPHFSNPDGLSTDGTFGTINFTNGNMRIMQAAVKFIF
jgi:hypothetical protein